MPDVNGRFYYSDYKQELKDRGFDGFSEADLGTYVNRGYFAVARKTRWFWERVWGDFSISPGAASIDIWPQVGGSLPYFRSLIALYKITPDRRARLVVMDQDRFMDYWLNQDLTSNTIQGEPSWFAEWDNKLYILPPPREPRQFRAYYHRIVAPLIGPQDQPITPVDFDEAIIDAARMRAHIRSQEVSLGQEARVDLEEAFDDMRAIEEDRVEEEPSRVKPDDTWL